MKTPLGVYQLLGENWVGVIQDGLRELGSPSWTGVKFWKGMEGNRLSNEMQRAGLARSMAP